MNEQDEFVLTADDDTEGHKYRGTDEQQDDDTVGHKYR